jgi:tetratricopeptide (TPR) repeat protein
MIRVSITRCTVLWVHVGLIAAALAGPPRSVALAQSETGPSEAAVALAHARDLFAQGLAFIDRGHWEAAEDRFRRCYSIRASPVVAYNLASALEAQGELAEASRLLRSILEHDDVSGILRRASAQRLENIEPRLAYLTIALSSPSDRALVLVDGSPLPEGRIGARTPVDPGRHEVTGRDPRGAATVVIDAAPGASLEVELALHAHEDLAASLLEDDSDPRPGTPYRRRRWLWSTLGAAVASSVIATVLVTRDDRENPGVEAPTMGMVVAELGRRTSLR